MEHFDVLIVGAGLSGIGAAYHLQTKCPGKRYVIIEGRASIGGTWDLFRYPGIRSDSDMYTLGYSFRPWRDPKAIADGPAILSYIRETARDYGIDRNIRYHHRLSGASWSSEDAMWTVDVTRENGDVVQMTCKFLFLCTGYYDYENGYKPEFPGESIFRGQVIHPQNWPAEFDYTGKRVVVIGSGATAVTLVPAMTDKATHVTMLQRSPTYIIPRPSEDKIANWLRRRLPARTAYQITRWKNVLLGMFFYSLSRKRPNTMKKFIMKGVRKHLGDAFDAQHFTPPYNPWDQRLCLVPDADLFTALRDGKASVVTDQIETFTDRGIELKSGKHLDADVIVTATGLNLKIMSGVELLVDGKPVDMSMTMAYKGMMYSDVPNLFQAFGYTNASWTLKCDLTAEYACRLMNHMAQHGYLQCTPRRNDPSVLEETVLDFTSSYVQRVLPTLPKQGSKKPWRLHQNYARDLLSLRYTTLDDGVMEFRK